MTALETPPILTARPQPAQSTAGCVVDFALPGQTFSCAPSGANETASTPSVASPYVTTEEDAAHQRKSPSGPAKRNDTPILKGAPNLHRRQAEVGPTIEGVQGKAELLADLMSNPETYDKFGPAWKLALRMLHTRAGVLVGTHDDIVRMLGHVSKDSLRNWIKHLSDQGIITAEQKGWQVALKLQGTYMKAATAPELIERSVMAIPVDDPKVEAMRKIVEGAEVLGGRVRLTLEDCIFGEGNGRKRT